MNVDPKQLQSEPAGAEVVNTRLFTVLDGYWGALHRGEHADPDSWLARHPEGADGLPDLELVARLHRAARILREDSRLDQPGPAVKHPQYLPAGTKLGEYVLERLLGHGGMGEVYLARDELMDRHVAVKVLRAQLTADAGLVDRFLKEVRLQARLKHPNIVTAMHASIHEGRLYLVMEYVAGSDLQHHVQETGPLKPVQACACIRQAALGLDHAHRQNIVHRDIKPSNLLLVPDGTVKIVDFGLARLADGGSHDRGGPGTVPGLFMGTPGYASPEQAQDASQADARSDLYSLGRAFYYLLTGLIPGRPGSDPLRAMRPDVPEAVAAVADKLVASKPQDRYPSASALVEALDAATSMEVSSASSPAGSLPGSIAPARPRAESEATVPMETATNYGTSSRWLGHTAIRPIAAFFLLAVVSVGLAAIVAIVCNAKFPSSAEKSVSTDRPPIDRIRPEPMNKSPFDRIGPEALPENERQPGQPPELVAIIGDRRKAVEGEASFLCAMAVAPNGRLLLGYGTGVADLWDVPSMRLEATLDVKDVQGVTAVALSPNGQRAVVAGWHFTPRLWNLDTGVSIERFSPYRQPVDSVVTDSLFTADGTGVFMVYRGNPTVILWNVEGKQERSFSAGIGSGYMARLSVSADGTRLLASGFLDGMMHLWDVTTGDELRRWEHGGEVSSVALAPNGQLAATGCHDGLVRLWRLTELGNAPKQVLDGRPGKCLCMAISPDGRHVVSGSPSRLILWDTSGNRLKDWTVPCSVVRLAFGDTRHLLVGLANGAVWVLRLDS